MKTAGPKQPVTPVPIRECPQCGYKTHIRNEDDEFDMIVQDNAEKALEIDDAKQRIAELERQRDELLADAERYRALKDWLADPSDKFDGVIGAVRRIDELDAAIDAARRLK